MRSPERIDMVLSVIRDVWMTNPELRLGQLLVNAVAHQDLFHTEDAVLAAKLHLLVSNNGVTHAC